MSNTTTELLTTDEVAELCRVDAATARWWRHVGRGPRGFKLPQSRRVLYRRTDIEQWLAQAYDATESAAR